MEVPFAFLADAANYSQSGTINVLGIFNQVSATNFPTVHPSMALVMRLEASPAEYGQTKQLEIRLMDEDGKALGSLSADLEIPPEESGSYHRNSGLNHGVSCSFSESGEGEARPSTDGPSAGACGES